MPSLVIFDCDGVLVDTELASNGVLVEKMREVGLDMTVAESNATFRGLTMPDCWEIIEARIGRALPEGFADAFGRREAEVFAGTNLAMEGVCAAIDGVEAQGCATCVASNGATSKMRATLGGAGLWERFEGRIFSAVEHVTRGKPHPDLFLYAASALGVEPADCVVVEDSPTGVRAARAAGMRVLGFAHETAADDLREAGADVFSSLAEVPARVAALG